MGIQSQTVDLSDPAVRLDLDQIAMHDRAYNFNTGMGALFAISGVALFVTGAAL